MAAFNDNRVRVVSPGRRPPKGDFVLLWMQRERRLSHNHALDWALARARELRIPLVVYEELTLDLPWPNLRHGRFLLEGMRDNADNAEARGFLYWPYVQTRRSQKSPWTGLAQRAAIVVTDDFPVAPVPEKTKRLADRIDAPVLAIDGNGLVPLALLGAPPPVARSLRPRLHRALLEAWKQRASKAPESDDHAALDPPFALWDPADLESTLARLPLDRSVPAAPLQGGARAARARLAHFVAHKLDGYAKHHSKPLPPDEAFTSGLSPYLHAGHISIAEVTEAASPRPAARARDASSPRRRATRRASSATTPTRTPSSTRPSSGATSATSSSGTAARMSRASPARSRIGPGPPWKRIDATVAASSTPSTSGNAARRTTRSGTPRSASSS